MPYWDRQRKLGALAVLINFAVLWKTSEAVWSFQASEGWTTTVVPWFLVIQLSMWVTWKVVQRPIRP